MIVMRFMKMAAMTTMMAGLPITVGLGCFSPVQRLDEYNVKYLLDSG
jgi:hypothetical protein